MARMLRVRKEKGESLCLHEFPNFHESGSVIGMKKLYYGKDALLVKCGQFIYNVDKETYEKALLMTN